MRGLTCARPGILVNFGDSAFSGGTAPTARRAPRAHRCAMRAPNPGDAAVRARRPHLRVRVARLLASTTAPPPHAQARFAHSPAPRATQYSSQSPRTPASRHVHLVHRAYRRYQPSGVPHPDPIQPLARQTKHSTLTCLLRWLRHRPLLIFADDAEASSERKTIPPPLTLRIPAPRVASIGR